MENTSSTKPILVTTHTEHNIHKDTLVLESLFNIVAGLTACNLIKKRLQHSCFPVNIAKFPRTAFLIEPLRWILLTEKKSKNLNTIYLMSSIFVCFWKTNLLLFSLFSIKIRWKYVFLGTMQSHGGFICSRRLFITFSNLTSILINVSTFVKTNNKRKKYENCLWQVFHLSYTTRKKKHDFNKKFRNII